MSGFCVLITTNSDDINLTSDLKLDVGRFVDELQERFPDIDLHVEEPESNSSMCLTWELNRHSFDTALDSMSGEMACNRRWIYLNAHSKPETITKFIGWYKAFIANEYRLYVTASWSGDPQELTDNMDATQILQFIQEL
jgi:hypothetical protein